MNIIEKLYTPIIFVAILIGMGLGQFQMVSRNAESFLVPLLMVMLYITFFQVPLENIKHSFKNIRFTYVSLLINFLWTPFLAWGLASIFLGENPALYIGFIMLMVTPCTDWYLIFTGIAKGNVALSTAILPLNLILQIILLPFYLLLFGGTTGVIELSFLAKSILVVLFLPLLLSFATTFLLRKRTEQKKRFLQNINVLPIILLSLAIIAMFASQGELLMENLDVLWKIMIPILLFFVVNFFVGRLAGSVMNFPETWKTSLNMTTLARNSPIALAIAMTAFPNEPLIALALVIGPLLELPVLAVVSQLLLFLSKKREKSA
ncbi:arsenic resistance protein [Salimicrobium flavidum]|uniref:Arsenite efflux pump ArsB, ACR3 family n=1 Tax=Salimicrobium flavidum TaxID=570947 RepID=A0A1N7JA31_9BACI|nr:bile acid:sodium symporter [Salimicrobium flavidum]SIS46121.1 Arsenite efflux pump ArsB, ACR3 family [Salimicrobium flavidum]